MLTVIATLQRSSRILRTSFPLLCKQKLKIGPIDEVCMRRNYAMTGLANSAINNNCIKECSMVNSEDMCLQKLQNGTIAPDQSANGNRILEEFSKSEKSIASIHEVIAALTTDMLEFGLPYFLDQENYGVLFNNLASHYSDFSANQLLYFANLHLHIENRNGIADKSLLRALNTKMEDLLIVELIQLAELLAESHYNVRQTLPQMADLFNIKIRFNKALDAISFEELCEVSKMCFLTSSKKTKSLFNYIIERGLATMDISQAIPQLYLAFPGEYFHQTQYHDLSEFEALKDALRSIHLRILENIDKFEPCELVKIVNHPLLLHKQWKDFFFNLEICMETGFFRSSDQKIQMAQLNILRAIAEQGHYSEHVGSKMLDLIAAKGGISLKQDAQLIPWLSLQESNLSGLLVQQDFHSLDLCSSLRIELLFDFLHLNLFNMTMYHYLISLAKNMTELFNNSYNNVGDTCRIFLLGSILHKRAPKMYPKMSATLKTKLRHNLNNNLESLSQDTSRHDFSYIFGSLLALIPENSKCFKSVAYRDIGIIDVLIIFDENGSAKLKTPNVDKSYLHFDNIDQTNNNSRVKMVAVLNVANEYFKNRLEPRRSQKYFAECLLRDGVQVCYNYAFLPRNQREYILGEQLISHGVIERGL